MPNIYFDFETRSPVPIRLGIDNYFSRAQPLILTYAIDEGPVYLVDFTQSPGKRPNVEAFADATWIAHNAQFDRRVLERLLDVHLPIERFRCTQAQAYSHGLPGSLETLGEVLGIKLKKLTGDDGHKLMLFFCTPRAMRKDGTPVWNEPHEHPEQWEKFKLYAIRDVEALREVYKKLPTWNYQGENLETWFLDQRINERGFALDKQLAGAAQRMLEVAKGTQQRYANALTLGDVTSVTQRQKLLDWFNSSGLEIASMKASDIREALESDDLPPAHRFLLELRLEGSKSSGAKYRRGLECVGPDGRIRDTMLFSGANRTGRWSGRNFQPQNLPRPSAHWEDLDKANPWKPIEEIAVPAVRTESVEIAALHGGVNAVCNDIIRSCIVTELGNEFVSADWANIESRFLAWCTDNAWKLEYFRAVDRGEAADSYKALWCRFFNMKIEDVTKTERQAAKRLDLACGYLGSVGALIAMSILDNVDMTDWPKLVLPKATEQQLKKAHRAWRTAFINGEDFGVEPDIFKAAHIMVQLYREANAAVVDEGYHIGSVVNDAMRNPNTLFRAAKCDIWYNGQALIIQLPSKRRLFYWSPQLREEDELDIETGEIKRREVFYYKASRGKQWRWLKGWPGLWIENICQAGCNDVLRIGLLEVQRYCLQEPRIAAWLNTLPANARTPLVLHVHDEPTAELPRGLLSHEKLEWLLTDNLAAKYNWLHGLPLAASGWTGGSYRK
jgi:DNA polymerase